MSDSFHISRKASLEPTSCLRQGLYMAQEQTRGHSAHRQLDKASDYPRSHLYSTECGGENGRRDLSVASKEQPNGILNVAHLPLWQRRPGLTKTSTQQPTPMGLNCSRPPGNRDLFWIFPPAARARHQAHHRRRSRSKETDRQPVSIRQPSKKRNTTRKQHRQRWCCNCCPSRRTTPSPGPRKESSPDKPG